ncbi:hypothetical protein [Tunturibacter empetritectus]|uniref:Spy/CpxP family protein refolding chaperone n=1 Tax=Tunturiibacter lichenicola TaxID=2051959 RepID=A0A7W8J682_9BACT|nr:hypothetical protein [Edaphobacter lichenicola]MBB5343389.1 Spy/CpxP family protein refolding chaperone [Edaphobacter lichenicola]
MYKFQSPNLVFGFALIVGLSGSTAHAQDQSPPSAGTSPSASTQVPQTGHVPNPQHQAKMMAKKLGLTTDQQAKLEPILADRDQQVESVRADSTLAPKDRRAKLRGINQDSDSKIESVLSDTQKQQYEQMKQDRKAGKQQQSGNFPTS